MSAEPAAGPSLVTKSLDTEGRVLHLGSFSKILAPSMQLGSARAAPEDPARRHFLPHGAAAEPRPADFSGIADDWLVHGITQLGRLLGEHLAHERD